MPTNMFIGGNCNAMCDQHVNKLVLTDTSGVGLSLASVILVQSCSIYHAEEKSYAKDSYYSCESI